MTVNLLSKIHQPFLFNANHASAALNKWIKEQLTDSYVIHGFRHSMRDRLRAVRCPSDIVDRIGDG